MIKIIRVEGNLNESRIEGILVSKLPPGLKERVVTLLEKFDGIEVITVGSFAETITLIPNKPFTRSKFAGGEGLVGELLFVRKLYKFWHRKKWQNSALGCFFCGAKVKTNEIVCDDLGCQQMAKDFNSMIDG